MRCCLVNLLFLLLTLKSFSQVKVYNTSLIDTTVNQLYTGIENLLSVKAPEVKGSLSFQATKLRVQSFERDIYIARALETGRDTLKVLYRGKSLLQWPLTIDTLPPPVARIGVYQDTVLSVQQILGQPFLGVVFPAANWKSGWIVSEFMAQFEDTENDQKIKLPGTGNSLSEAQLKMIRKLKAGERIVFDTIYGYGPGGRRSKFPELRIYIK